LGGNAALRTLLNEAHRRGMRIILDGVFNHASRGFYQFHHILENGPDSPYIDWFIIKGFPLHAYEEDREPNYAAWWNLHALPKFNTQTPAVREFLWNVARHWVEFGIDGWRLDVPEEIHDPAFWQEFRRRVKAANPEAYLVGEIWHPAPEWLQGDRFDAVMNYPFTRACLGFFISEAVDEELVRGMGYYPVPHLSVTEFADTVDTVLGLYDPAVTYAQLNLLDSHDTARFLTLARGDESALRLATLFQMTYPGAPCIYYGDEIGMEGGRDPDNRRAFPWDESRWNTGLRDFVKRCIALRHAYPALRRGTYTRLHAADDVYAFGRRLGDETLVVALNVAQARRAPEIRVANYLPDGTLLRDVWSKATVRVVGGVLREVKLSPRSGAVWVVE
jgi:neopullulanase